MKKLLKDALVRAVAGVSRLLPTAMLVGGAAAVAIGIGLLSVPAGVISAGALSVLGGVLLIRGGGDDA